MSSEMPPNIAVAIVTATGFTVTWDRITNAIRYILEGMEFLSFEISRNFACEDAEIFLKLQ